jgi:hypothetical protein
MQDRIRVDAEGQFDIFVVAAGGKPRDSIIYPVFASWRYRWVFAGFSSARAAAI